MKTFQYISMLALQSQVFLFLETAKEKINCLQKYQTIKLNFMNYFGDHRKVLIFDYLA